MSNDKGFPYQGKVPTLLHSMQRGRGRYRVRRRSVGVGGERPCQAADGLLRRAGQKDLTRKGAGELFGSVVIGEAQFEKAVHVQPVVALHACDPGDGCPDRRFRPGPIEFPVKGQAR